MSYQQTTTTEPRQQATGTATKEHIALTEFLKRAGYEDAQPDDIDSSPPYPCFGGCIAPDRHKPETIASAETVVTRWRTKSVWKDCVSDVRSVVLGDRLDTTWVSESVTFCRLNSCRTCAPHWTQRVLCYYAHRFTQEDNLHVAVVDIRKVDGTRRQVLDNARKSANRADAKLLTVQTHSPPLLFCFTDQRIRSAPQVKKEPKDFRAVTSDVAYQALKAVLRVGNLAAIKQPISTNKIGDEDAWSHPTRSSVQRRRNRRRFQIRYGKHEDNEPLVEELSRVVREREAAMGRQPTVEEVRSIASDLWADMERKNDKEAA